MVVPTKKGYNGGIIEEGDDGHHLPPRWRLKKKVYSQIQMFLCDHAWDLLNDRAIVVGVW